MIPTLNRFKKDLIITVDDDIFYPNDLIQKMMECYKKLGGNNPVSFGMKTSDWIINGKIIHTHYGRGSVVSYKYFNLFIKNIIEKLYTTNIFKYKGIIK